MKDAELFISPLLVNPIGYYKIALCLLVCLSVSQSVSLSVNLLVCLSVSLSVCLSVRPVVSGQYIGNFTDIFVTK